jgi:hypothetical protein
VGIGFNLIGQKIGEEIEKFVKLLFEARKDDNRTALLYNSAGEDSVPLDGERLIVVKVDGAGKYTAAGVLTQSQGAKPGEKIYFARDPDAAIVSKVKMLNDGSVSIDTNTETTDDATGNYSRVIKGITDILEKDDRVYKNEKNVSETIEGTLTRIIKKAVSETIEDALTRTIKKNYTGIAEGDYKLEGKKNINVKSGASSVNEAALSNKIKGGTDVTLAAPGAAAWCPNAIPACPFGMPHGGAAAGIPGLKGE